MSPHRMPACLLPLTLTLAAAAPALAQEDSYERTVALEAGGNLSIATSGGSVLLLAWDQPQVEIRARIEAPAGTDGDYAREIIGATRIDVRETAGAVSVASDFSEVERRGFFDRRRTRPDVHYEIQAPRDSNLDIELERGAGTTLRGFAGPHHHARRPQRPEPRRAGRHGANRAGAGPDAGQRLQRLADARRGARRPRRAHAPAGVVPDRRRADERGAARRPASRAIPTSRSSAATSPSSWPRCSR